MERQRFLNLAPFFPVLFIMRLPLLSKLTSAQVSWKVPALHSLPTSGESQKDKKQTFKMKNPLTMSCHSFNLILFILSCLDIIRYSHSYYITVSIHSPSSCWLKKLPNKVVKLISRKNWIQKKKILIFEFFFLKRLTLEMSSVFLIKWNKERKWDWFLKLQKAEHLI